MTAVARLMRPGGLEGQKARLEKEGHVVLQKGKKLVVKDFERKLIMAEDNFAG